MYQSSTNAPRQFGGVSREMYDHAAAKQARAAAATQPKQHPRVYVGNNFAREDLVDVRALTYNTKALTAPDGTPRGTTGSFTWLRILPTRDMNAPDQWAPPTAANGNTGQWLWPVKLWKGGIKKRVAMVVQYAWEDDQVEWEHPVTRLRYAIWKMVDAGAAPAWFGPYVSKDKGKLDKSEFGRGVPWERLPLPMADWSMFVRAIVYAWGEHYPNPPQGLGPDDKIHMLDLGSMAGGALVADVAEFGPVNGLAGGDFHCFYRLGDDPRKPEAARRPGLGYEVFRSPTAWANGPSPDLSAYESILHPKLVPFTEVFHKQTRAEAGRLLCEAFPPEILRAGWKGDADLLRLVDEAYGPEPVGPIYQQQPPQAYGQPAVYGAPPQQSYAPASPPVYGPPQGQPQAPPAYAPPPQGPPVYAPPQPPQGGYGQQGPPSYPQPGQAAPTYAQPPQGPPVYAPPQPLQGAYPPQAPPTYAPATQGPPAYPQQPVAAVQQPVAPPTAPFQPTTDPQVAATPTAPPPATFFPGPPPGPVGEGPPLDSIRRAREVVAARAAGMTG